MPTIAIPAGSIRLTGGWLATAEETFAAGAPVAPVLWAELEQPDDALDLVAPVGLADRATYYSGWKAASLLAAGRIRRALSDDEGQYEVQRFDVTLSDLTRTWRTWLGQPSTDAVVLNHRIVVRLASDAWRRAELRPRTVAIGLIRGYRLG